MDDAISWYTSFCNTPGCINKHATNDAFCQPHRDILNGFNPYTGQWPKDHPMSTSDVPGARKSNNDELHGGCWAEHPDGSLILVHSTEGKRVIYDVFELKTGSAHEFRGIMAETEFKDEFSYRPDKDKSDGVSERWTWHDKSPFPWDKVIEAGEKMLAIKEVDPSGKALAVAAVGRGLIETQGEDDIEPFKNADEMTTAARRVAKTLGLKGGKFDLGKAKHLTTSKGGKTAKETVLSRIGRAFGMMRKDT